MYEDADVQDSAYVQASLSQWINFCYLIKLNVREWFVTCDIRDYVKWTIIVACLLLPIGSSAIREYTPQRADPVLEPWRWQHVEQLDGLGVLCMDEAPDGTFWFGVTGGVAQYDGQSVRSIPFDEDILKSITLQEPDPLVTSILAARDGSILLTVNKCFIRWAEGRWELIENNLANQPLENRLVPGNDGRIFLLTRSAIWLFNEDLSEKILVGRTTGEGRFLKLCQDARGDLWVAKDPQDEMTMLVHIPMREGLPVEESKWIESDIPLSGYMPVYKGGLLAGSDGRIQYADNHVDNGVLSFDPSTDAWEQVGEAGRHYSLIQSRQGVFWTGNRGGFVAHDSGKSRTYSAERIGMSDYLFEVQESNDGRFWLIGRLGQVYIVDTRIQKWQTFSGLHFQCESSEGVQWFITDKFKVVSYNPVSGKWLIYGNEDGVSDWVRGLFVSSHGLIWGEGTRDGAAAVCVFNGSNWNSTSHPEFAGTIAPGSGYEAPDGTLWFSGLGGVGGALQFEVTKAGEVRLRKHYRPPAVPLRSVGFAQMTEGKIWMGLRQVMVYDSVTNTSQPAEGIPWRQTDDIVVDGAGELWVAKGGFGVYRKQAEGWRKYTRADGLASDMVSKLLPLRDGTLLAATAGGISRFDGKTWTSKAFRESFVMPRDGGSIKETADGGIWFNFTKENQLFWNGVPADMSSFYNHFFSIRYMPDYHPPETLIEDFVTKVAHPGNVLITWSALDLWEDETSEQLQFSWRLDGGEWAPYTKAAGKTFLGLARGRHVLEVKARDRDFNIDSTPATRSFSVVAPIWLQAWFIAPVSGVAALAVLLIWVLVRNREHRLLDEQQRIKDQQAHLMEMDQLKTGFFTNISHELNTPLSSIMLPLEYLVEEESDKKRKQMLSLALRNANRAATLVSQLLDFRKLQQGKVHFEPVEDELVQHVRDGVELQQPLAEANGISIRLEGLDVCRGWFDPETLLKIVQNLVGNAIKYSPTEGVVRVILDVDRNKAGERLFSLTVEDSGPGIAADHLKHVFDRFYRVPGKLIVDGSGVGLNLTKELVELCGGTIGVESPAQEDMDRPGSRFVVLLPIDRTEELEGREV